LITSRLLVRLAATAYHQPLCRRRSGRTPPWLL